MKKTKLEMEKPGSGQKPRSFVREKRLRYFIEIEVIPKSGILRVADEFLLPLDKNGDIISMSKPFIERLDDKIRLPMEGQANSMYYDRYLDYSILSLPLYPPHYPHITAIRQEFSNWFFFYFEPRERMRSSDSIREVRRIGSTGEDLGSFLNTLRALDDSQFKSIEKALHMIIPEVQGIDVKVNNLGEVEFYLKEGKTLFPARVLSEGTLRILGLLALGGAKEPPALLGFEEPENGIHPRRIRMVADLLLNRVSSNGPQLIATTHSPILPDMLPDKNLFVCRKESGRTWITPFSRWGVGGRKNDIEDALDDRPGSNLTVSERLLRGDFDA